MIGGALRERKTNLDFLEQELKARKGLGHCSKQHRARHEESFTNSNHCATKSRTCDHAGARLRVDADEFVLVALFQIVLKRLHTISMRIEERHTSGSHLKSHAGREARTDFDHELRLEDAHHAEQQLGIHRLKLTAARP